MRETEVVTTKYLNVFTDEIFDSAEEAERDENDFLMNHQGVHFFSYRGEELNFHDFYDEEVNDLGFEQVKAIYFESAFAAEWFNKQFLSLLDVVYYNFSDSVLIDFNSDESMYIADDFNSDEDRNNTYYIPLSVFSKRVYDLQKTAKEWGNKKIILDMRAQK